MSRPQPCVNVGDLGNRVYLYSDRKKITSQESLPLCVKKFTGGQLRASFYKVKLAEVYLVPKGLGDLPEHDFFPPADDEELVQADNNIQSDIAKPVPTHNSQDEVPITFTHSVPVFEDPIIDTSPDD